MIDDDPFTCNIMAMLFQTDGYSVAAASNGAKGLELAAKDMPQLFIIDLMLPNMSGYEIIRAIRGDNSFKHIPILVCTAKNGSVDIHKSFDIGADDYISKPFDTKRLRYKVKKLLGHPIPQE